MRSVHQSSRLLAAAFILATASSAFAADDGAWTVGKSSGEVWLTSSGAQPASLTQEAQLKPGDTVRTGGNGRVLLRRGEETMLISPNSVIGLPQQKTEGLATTILQQAGSILLEVEKRNVKHFEVETPYLAAVVKGTQFRVTVNAGSTSVDVLRGQVEVADFRSGQIAQVMPGQHATTFTSGKPGLSLSGSGTFSPIEDGKPRAPSIERIPVPRAGLTLPRNAANGPGVQPSHHADTHSKPGVIRISSSIGEVRLNFHRVTHGLARGTSTAHGRTRSAANTNTIWSSSGSATNSAVASASQDSGSIAANPAAAAAANASTPVTSADVVTTVADVTGTGGGGGNNGNGNGNGGGNGNGANGNGHGNNGNHFGWWWRHR
jgi:hypothetical protein